MILLVLGRMLRVHMCLMVLCLDDAVVHLAPWREMPELLAFGVWMLVFMCVLMRPSVPCVDWRVV